MSDVNAVLGTLGLAMRAGQVVIGEPRTRELLSSGEAVLALMDADVAANTGKTIRDKCRTYGVPLFLVSQGRLGAAVGKPACMCLGVRRGGLGDQLLKKVLEKELDGLFREL